MATDSKQIPKITLILSLAIISVSICMVIWSKNISNQNKVYLQHIIESDDYKDEDNVVDVKYYIASVEAHKKSNYRLAVELLDKQTKALPSHAQSYYLLARTYEEHILPGNDGKMLTDMKDNYLKYLKLKPNGKRSKFVKLKLAQNILRSALNENKSTDLDNAYKILITLDQNDPDVRMALGAVYLAKNVNDKAAIEFENAVSLDANETKTKYNSLGFAYIKSGKYKEAVKALEIAITIEPDNDYAYNNLGHAYLKIGKFIRAKQSFEKAVKLNPYNRKAEKNLNWVLTNKEIQRKIKMELDNESRINQIRKN